MTALNPFESEIDGWEILALPTRSTKTDRENLLESGYDRYRDTNARTDGDALMEDIDKFVIKSLEKPDRQAVVDDPFTTHPGKLAVLTTVGTCAIAWNSRVKKHSGRGRYKPRLKLHHAVRDYFRHHVQWLCRKHEERSRFLCDFAEHGYRRRQEDKYGPPPGRVCTGIVPRPELGDGLFTEIPLEHASMQCFIKDDEGTLISKIRDRNVYIPAWHLNEKIHEQTGKAWELLVDTFEETCDAEAAAFIIERTPTVQRKLIRLFETNRFDELFEERKDPLPLIVMTKALNAFDHEEIACGKWVTAEDLYTAISQYRPDPLERSIVRKMTGPRSIGRRLAHLEGHRDIDIERRDGYPNHYRIRDSRGRARNVMVEKPEDLFELPCFNNLDEELKTGKPTREVLFLFVRVLLSLENEFSDDEIVDLFRRWPWFDEEITRYNVAYERTRTMPDGSPPLPIGCNNDNTQFSHFCIGKEICPYRIYSSLPMKKEVKEQVRQID